MYFLKKKTKEMKQNKYKKHNSIKLSKHKTEFESTYWKGILCTNQPREVNTNIHFFKSIEL